MSSDSTPILSRYRPDYSKILTRSRHNSCGDDLDPAAAGNAIPTEEDCIRAFKGNNEDKAVDVLSHIPHPIEVGGLHVPEWDTTNAIHSRVSLLHFAAERGWKDLCKALILNYDFPIDIQDSKGYTPLHYAVGSGSLEAAMLLVYFRCSVHMCRPVSPIQLACREGNVKVAEYLMTQCGCSLKVCDSSCNTPLHSAAQRGHIKMADYLLSSGKVALMLRNVEGDTALHCACSSGNVSMVLCLMGSDLIDVNSHNCIGDTPLHIACKNTYPTIVKYLLRKNIDVNHRNTLGNTPLHIACQSGHAQIVDMLLSSSTIDPSCGNDNGDTPLHMACREGHMLVVESVLNQTGGEALTKCLNKWGKTPLQLAPLVCKCVLLNLAQNIQI